MFTLKPHSIRYPIRPRPFSGNESGAQAPPSPLSADTSDTRRATSRRRDRLGTLKQWRGLYRMHRGHIRHERRLHLFNLVSALLPNDLLAGVLRAWLLRRLGAEVADGALIKQGVYLRGTFQLHLGRDSSINVQSLLQCDDLIEVGERAVIGARVVILTSTHEFGPPERRLGSTIHAPVRIGPGAWVASGVTIMPGVTIGTGSVISTGAVVTKDVPPNCLAAGAPARVIRRLDAPPGADGHSVADPDVS